MSRLEKKYIDFKSLKKHLDSAAVTTLTFAVDKLLLKANTIDELYAAIVELKETKFKESNDFKSLAIVKKHIRYRQAHNRIIFSVNKKNQFRMTAIDYTSDEHQKSIF